MSKKSLKKVAQFLFGDFRNKFIALLVAGVLWFYISEEITALRTFDVPIQFVFPKLEEYKGMKVVWMNLREIRVTLRGPKAKMSFIPRNLTIRPEIPAGTKKGEYVVLPLIPAYLNLPPGVTCTDISPNKVEFILSRIIRKKIAVRLNYDASTLPSHYKIEYYQPKTVFVKGPEYLLEQVKILNTTPLDWKNIPSSRVESYSVQIPDRYKDELICEQTVSVKFLITEPLEKISLLLKVFILLSENFNYNIDLHTKRVELSFRGPKKELEKLKADPEKYADVYIVPEEMDPSEIKGMDKNQDPPKELRLKVSLDLELKRTKLVRDEELPTIKFYILGKKNK